MKTVDIEKAQERINKLLWTGKPMQAANALESTKSELLSEIDALRERISELEEACAGLDRMKPPVSISVLSVPKKAQEFDKKARNKKIVELAALAKDPNGYVSSVDLKKVLRKHNVQLGVAENRQETVIANVLIRTGGYHKISKGVYRLQK